jgi:hypothetical protein
MSHFTYHYNKSDYPSRKGLAQNVDEKALLVTGDFDFMGKRLFCP